jgi:hypothetical protein
MAAARCRNVIDDGKLLAKKTSIKIDISNQYKNGTAFMLRRTVSGYLYF